MGGILSVLILIAAFVGATVSIDRIRAVYDREGLSFWERWQHWGRWRDPGAWQAKAELVTWMLLLTLCLFVIGVWIIRQL